MGANMKIHFEKGLQIENAQLICQWSNALGESFQKQWMGPKISYPLIAQSLQNEEIESISLTVFESNQRAKNLYQKEGFEIVQIIEVPERKYIMRKFR